jgi:hypothetical protein
MSHLVEHNYILLQAVHAHRIGRVIHAERNENSGNMEFFTGMDACFRYGPMENPLWLEARKARN